MSPPQLRTPSEGVTTNSSVWLKVGLLPVATCVCFFSPPSTPSTRAVTNLPRAHAGAVDEPLWPAHQAHKGESHQQDECGQAFGQPPGPQRDGMPRKCETAYRTLRKRVAGTVQGRRRPLTDASTGPSACHAVLREGGARTSATSSRT